MSTTMKFDQVNELAGMLEPMLHTARVPGAAIAVVGGDGYVWTRGFGHRDLNTLLPVTANTVYPIASTTKAMNATLIGMLVDEGRLAWDLPVREYIPEFRLGDLAASAQTTIRDLLAMRTGLPRHDWLWIENEVDRSEVTRRLRYLDVSAGFRERFQYNNITATVAGHLTEVVTGRSWEDLLREKVLEPLGMRSSGFALPQSADVSQSYQEGRHRNLLPVPRFAGEVTGPSGGSVHSTVQDMSRWLSFNLNGGSVLGQPLIRRDTLAEIQSPQVVARGDPSCPTPNAAYGMGWFVDTYRGCNRLSHGGLLHYLNSSVMLFPSEGIGVVSFVNFSALRLAPIINQSVFEVLMGLEPQASVDRILRRYEEQVEKNKARNASVRRIAGASPSHDLDAYVGVYEHSGYGTISIVLEERTLTLKRGKFTLPLEHWHYDAWVAAENDLFELHLPNAFDRHSPLLFETSADGRIAAFSLRLEPAVAPIRFVRM